MRAAQTPAGGGGDVIILRILVNAVIMALELGAVIALGWLGFRYPYWFAVLTIATSFAVGVVLEKARFTYDLPFFFDQVGWLRKLVYGAFAVVEATWKGLLAGLVALLTFSGTDDARRYWIAIAFAVTVWVGAVALRRLAISFQAKASRWGYFRLAIPLGLVFSVGLAVLNAFGMVRTPGVWEILQHITLDLPKSPNLEQLSELLFKLKLFFDGLVVAILEKFLPQSVANALGVVVSVNTLTGFIAAVYAVIIAETVLTLEDWNGRGS